MPSKGAKPIAVCCADLHLSHTPPLCRNETRTEWYEAQIRMLKEITETALHPAGILPILCAGDVFDRANCPVELINYMVPHIPPMLTVAGQHDLPDNSMASFNRSPLRTCEIAETVEMLEDKRWLQEPTLMTVQGASWKCPVPPPSRDKDISVLVWHNYVWHDHKTKHTAAKIENNVDNLLDTALEYDVIVTGDNHIPFVTTLSNGTVLCNCGSTMRRAVDQICFGPRMYMLYSDKTFVPVYFDTSRDNIIDDSTAKEIKSAKSDQAMKQFISTLSGTLVSEDDMFMAAIRQCLRQMNPQVSTLIKQAIEEIE